MLCGIVVFVNLRQAAFYISVSSAADVGFLTELINRIVFFFHRMTTFIRLKALSLCRGVQREGEEKKRKKDVYLRQQRLESFEGCTCSRCHCLRKLAPSSDLVWKEYFLQSVWN